MGRAGDKRDRQKLIQFCCVSSLSFVLGRKDFWSLSYHRVDVITGIRQPCFVTGFILLFPAPSRIQKEPSYSEYLGYFFQQISKILLQPKPTTNQLIRLHGNEQRPWHLIK